MVELFCRVLRPLIKDRWRRAGSPTNPRRPGSAACTCKRQQGNVARLLDRRRKTPLMRSAYARQPARHDLAALSDELPEHAVVLVVDVLDLFHAELADFLAPEKLASAFARWSAGTRAAPESRPRTGTIVARSIESRPFTRGRSFDRRRGCFSLFTHAGSFFLAGIHLSGAATSRIEYLHTDLPGYTAQAVAGVSLAAGAASTAGAGLTFLRDSRSCLILSRRFCSSSILTVRNLMTGSVTRRRRSSSWTTAPPPSTVSKM